MSWFDGRRSKKRWSLPQDAVYPVVIDPHDTVEELIDGAGYTHVDRELREGRFPLHDGPIYIAECELLPLCERYACLDTGRACAELAARGYRGATFHETLAFVQQHPHARRRPGDIIALGAVERTADTIHVLELWDRTYEKEFSLRFELVRDPCFGCYWIEHHRFLAVPSETGMHLL